MTPFEAVLEFHEKFNIEQNTSPVVNYKLRKLRWDLINEETKEVFDELIFDNWEWNDLKIDKAKLTKELADLLYVTIGTAVTFGLPLEEVFYEVHKSNMSKLGEDGKPIMRSDGKVLKGKNYKEPDLEKFFK